LWATSGPCQYSSASKNVRIELPASEITQIERRGLALRKRTGARQQNHHALKMRNAKTKMKREAEMTGAEDSTIWAAGEDLETEDDDAGFVCSAADAATVFLPIGKG
jgi:hypothetical protein